ncbi:class I SAM-dependent methyltransferase [bacterium]|nr:class I SAM-dependent methyltransferase [bacterium]
MDNYKTTIAYWEQKFGERLSTNKRYDAQEQLSYPEIEEGLKWLTQDAFSIIDFGSGTGSILLRCVFFGIQKAIGIDISHKAIELAKQTSKQNKMDTKTSFIVGSVESLEKFEDDSLDAGILFNLIDNILPDDAIFVLKEMNRILKNGGKLLIKLNECSPTDEFEENDYFHLISDDFYKEKSGLYFWNLSEKKFKEIISPYFDIVKFIEVPLHNTNHVNRLYYLKKI